jgi:hypothetical protein
MMARRPRLLFTGDHRVFTITLAESSALQKMAAMCDATSQRTKRAEKLGA